MRIRWAVAGKTMLAVLLAAGSCAAWSDDKPSAERSPDGTIHVPAFDLPLSSFLSPESQAFVKARDEDVRELRARCGKGKMDRSGIAEVRRCLDQWRAPLLQKLQARYPVKIETTTIGGVAARIVTPAGGVSAANEKRVLINVHGGGFLMDGGPSVVLEAIPIAAVGQFKVVAVDYRMAPEYQFPAASEDTAAVYRELLKTYEPKNIGIYGCSAGGLLTAQAMAWFQREGLPAPGAIGIFCSGAAYWGEGDSGPYISTMMGIPPTALADHRNNGYLQDVTFNDSLAFPIRGEDVLAKFPRTLLIAGTRDFALSSVAQTHSRLVANGVEAEMHLWEGLDHAFFFDPDLKESREVYDVVAKFFNRQLGKEPLTPAAKPSLRELLQPQIDAFAAADKQSPPEACQYLFVGSSSFVKWNTMTADMAPLPVINRGFGGSHIEYVNLWFDQVVAPYHPRAIVFYAGENDIGAGKSVERVVADFDEFMKKKTAAFGKTPVYFVSLKPSKLRYWQMGQQTKVNDAIRARAKKRSDLRYIDVVTPMLKDGKPMDLFVGDNLHMNPQGYEIWTRTIKSTLAPQAEAQARTCRKTLSK